MDFCCYLDKEEETLLLQIARDSLDTYIHTRAVLTLEDYPLTPRMREKTGAFVTLYRNHDLRGCIGYTRGLESLAETVRDNAINAGTRDPRFTPVEAVELSDIQIEISVLCPNETADSPFIKVHSLEDIQLGQDGLYLDHVGTRGGGLLLPQVAVEHGWTREAFLHGVCEKAGASPEAWQAPDATLYRFTAQVFSE